MIVCGQKGFTMDKVLFLVHIEDSFRKFFDDEFISGILERADEFDRIIALVSYVDDEDIIEELQGIVHEKWEWGWGYEPMKDCYNLDCVINERCSCDWDYIIETVNSAHDYTWIPPEIREKENWQNKELFVAGGYDGECLADWESVLGYLELPYNRCNEMIYG
jgi:hypothetical protein